MFCGAVKISDSRRAVIIIVVYSLSFLSVSKCLHKRDNYYFPLFYYSYYLF